MAHKLKALRLNNVRLNYQARFLNPPSLRKPIEACGTMLRATVLMLYQQNLTVLSKEIFLLIADDG